MPSDAEAAAIVKRRADSAESADAAPRPESIDGEGTSGDA